MNSCLVELFVHWTSERTRKYGILSLEQQLDKIHKFKIEFLLRGMKLYH